MRRFGHGAIVAARRRKRMSRTTRLFLVQAVFDRVARQLDAVGDLKLAERRLYVVLDRAVTQRQPGGDLFGRQSLRDVAQYLGFAFGQARHRCPGRARPTGLRDAPILPQHQPGQPRGEHRTSFSGRAHRIAEFVLRRTLDEIASRTSLYRLQYVVALVGCRKHQNARRRRYREHFGGGPGAVAVEQPHVHHHHVGVHDGGAAPGRRHPIGRRHHGEAGLGEVADHGVAPDRMVVDDHHRRGTVSSHSVPHPGPVLSVALPPSQFIRPTIDFATPTRPSLTASSSRPSAIPTPSSRMLTVTEPPRSSSSTYARASGPACDATLSSALVAAAHSSVATPASSRTGVAGTLTDTRSDDRRRSSAPTSVSAPATGSASVELTSRRNARSCSPASSANSAVSPPISRPRRETSASTWMAPSCTWRDNR